MEEMEELVKSDEEEIKVPMVAKKRGRPKGSPDKKPSIDSLSIDSVHTQDAAAAARVEHNAAAVAEYR